MPLVWCSCLACGSYDSVVIQLRLSVTASFHRHYAVKWRPDDLQAHTWGGDAF